MNLILLGLLLAASPVATAASLDQAQGLADADIEKNLLSKLPEARRSGDSLSIQTSSGAVALSDKDAGTEGSIRYRLVGFFNRGNGKDYLVHAQGYEGRGYRLVSGKRGGVASIAGKPMLSPMADRYLSVSCDLDARQNENKLTVLNADTLSVEHEIDFDQTNRDMPISGPWHANWDGNDIVFVMRTTDGDTRKDTFEVFRLKQVNRKWTQEAIK